MLESLETMNVRQASQPPHGGAQAYHARVYGREGDRYGVAGSVGGYWVAVAASCLLQPAVGDLVLVSMAGQDGYILAVLVQAEPDVSELRVRGDTRLMTEDGTLTVAASKGLRLAAGEALSIDARTIGLTSGALNVHARSVLMTGETHHSVYRERHDVAQYQRSVAVRTEVHSKDRLTRVSGHDELALGSQRIVVQNDWRVRAQHVDIRASKRASLDAEQVQLG